MTAHGWYIKHDLRSALSFFFKSFSLKYILFKSCRVLKSRSKNVKREFSIQRTSQTYRLKIGLIPEIRDSNHILSRPFQGEFWYHNMSC